MSVFKVIEGGPRRRWLGRLMNCSLLTADGATHLKRAVVALIGAILVVGLGVGARVAGTTAIGLDVDLPVPQAAHPAFDASHGRSFLR
jgi:hypothetical protein